MSVREIAAALGVSRSTASVWVRDIRLTDDQRRALLARNPAYNAQSKGAAVNAARARDRRLGYQQDGRRRIRGGRPLYLAGCILYWAEGDKRRNAVRFTNSDPTMIALFLRFLRECFDVPDTAVRVRCHVYARDDDHRRQVEQFCLDALGLPRACLSRSAVAVSRASLGKRRGVLPYGTCRLIVSDVRIAQTIFGSIQEYAGFDRPEWLE